MTLSFFPLSQPMIYTKIIERFKILKLTTDCILTRKVFILPFLGYSRLLLFHNPLKVQFWWKPFFMAQKKQQKLVFCSDPPRTFLVLCLVNMDVSSCGLKIAVKIQTNYQPRNHQPAKAQIMPSRRLECASWWSKS